MSDTQWSRYEVFGQEKEGRPHRSVGSVHAVDPEMALQNARDVFVRRPQTTSIWVVPAANILSKTQQEISENLDLKSHVDEEDKKAETYLVFQKLSQRPSMTFVVHTGQVEASSAIGALKKSVELFGENETYVWWVCPEIAVYKSTYDDIDSMFSQAHDKKYRMPQDYRLTLEMMELKRGKR
jgi:phenylacetate-CoA oxygenase PaaH subunit